MEPEPMESRCYRRSDLFLEPGGRPLSRFTTSMVSPSAAPLLLKATSWFRLFGSSEEGGLLGSPSLSWISWDPKVMKLAGAGAEYCVGQTKYIEDDNGIKKYFAAFHLYESFPAAVVVDDFGDFFSYRNCQDRYGNPRGKALTMVRTLALCRDAIIYANKKNASRRILQASGC